LDTQNITLSIPTKILKRIKVIAASKGVSVSGLLTRLLEDFALREEGYRQAMEDHLATLKRHSELGTDGDIRWHREELHER
jgi:hypothetical protein